MPSVLAFDIGIKNLAWCLMAAAPGQPKPQPQIISWENYNLLQDVEGAKAEATTCSHCKAKATYWSDDHTKFSCKRHVPTSRPVFLDDATKKPVTKMPAVASLRAVAKAAAQDAKKMTKEQLTSYLSTSYSFPLGKEAKATKTKEVGMNELYDGIRAAVRANWQAFSQADRVQLENQPAYKNPVMKTVQCFLFAALREAFYAAGQTPPAFELVHAKKKVEYEDKGDEGYAERKDNSKQKVEQILVSAGTTHANTWLAKFKSHKKRDDMADAFCMCLNALSI
jgi:hypothetical protein